MITRKTRRGIMALAALTAVSFWVGHKSDDEAGDPVAGLDPKLNYVLLDFELQFYDAEGQPTVNMQAPVLRNDPELQLGTVEHPTIRLNKPGAVWSLTSDAAIVTADKEHVRLVGAVHLQKHEISNGTRIELDTREVMVEVTPQTASTDQPVDIFDGYNQLSAIGLDLDMKSDAFKLRQQVKATYAVN